MTPPRIARAQRSALILLVFAGTLNYVDRATLSVTNPLIRHELGLSIADMGLLLSAFLWAYAFAQLPGEALLDRWGRGERWAPALSCGRWRRRPRVRGELLAVRRHPSVPGPGRGADVLGRRAGRARPVQRAQPRAADGIWNCTSSLGPTIAPPLLTTLMVGVGWRWMFIVMGLVGVVIGVLWYAIYREVDEAGAPRPRNGTT